MEVFKHYLRKRESATITDKKTYPKNNVLMIGPSGSGKTLLGKKCAKMLDVPFIKIDAASSVKSGIVGSSLSDNFARVYNSLENKKDLEYAIVFIDEFDKLASRYSHDRDAIQTELLNIIGELSLIHI